MRRPGINRDARRCYAVRGGVVKIRIQARGRGVLVIVGSTKSQNLAVGQDYRVHLNPRLRHIGSPLPDGSGRSQIDQFRSGSRWTASSEDDDLRFVIVGWS